MKPEAISLFLDESRVEAPQGCRFITCAVVVSSDLWAGTRAQERDFRSRGQGSRLQRIAQLLKTTNGFAVLTYADVDTALLPAGVALRTRGDLPVRSVRWHAL